MRFGCAPRVDARPLLILSAMVSVNVAFDILDAGGRDVPTDILDFPTIGDMKE